MYIFTSSASRLATGMPSRTELGVRPSTPRRCEAAQSAAFSARERFVDSWGSGGPI